MNYEYYVRMALLHELIWKAGGTVMGQQRVCFGAYTKDISNLPTEEGLMAAIVGALAINCGTAPPEKP